MIYNREGDYVGQTTGFGLGVDGSRILAARREGNFLYDANTAQLDPLPFVRADPLKWGRNARERMTMKESTLAYVDIATGQRGLDFNASKQLYVVSLEGNVGDARPRRVITPENWVINKLSLYGSKIAFSSVQETSSGSIIQRLSIIDIETEEIETVYESSSPNAGIDLFSLSDRYLVYGGGEYGTAESRGDYVDVYNLATGETRQVLPTTRVSSIQLASIFHGHSLSVSGNLLAVSLNIHGGERDGQRGTVIADLDAVGWTP